MKRIVLIILSVLILTGCKATSVDNIKTFKDKNDKLESYELLGTMKIISNEDEFTYNISVGVKDNKYYKVSLINTINNHEQVILKNDEGVYLVTPELNKSFKFMSEWPNNSSQAYLIESLINDVNKDTKTEIEKIKNEYKINAKVNYPNNPKLDHEIITTDEDFNVKKVEVMDAEDKPQITVEISKINKTSKFDKNYFVLDELITTKDKEEQTKEDKECMETCTNIEEECKKTCKIESTSNILEDIIYPLYVPTDTYLKSKDTIATDKGNRVILTFSGVDPFILVEEVSSQNDEMNIIPVNGEPLFLGASIGAISDNSIYWTSNGIDYYLTSKTLDAKEMMTIAESVTNSTNLVASIK